MTYYTDLIHQIAMLCFSMSLVNSEAFVQAVDQQRLTPTQYIAVLAAAATRIGGCSNYVPADAFAAAARVTERALVSYDPKSGDQTLDLMGLVTEYMRYPPDSFPADKVAEGMLSVFETWIDVWVGAEAAIDADWDADAIFPPFEHPDVRDGQTPETIVNVKVRAAYERHLAEKHAFLARQRNQQLLRRALDQYRDSYIAYAREIPKTPAVTDRLRALAGRVSDHRLVLAMTP
jgi:hypothetical protein